MISLRFTISLKGNQAASSHISVFAELRSPAKAFPAMTEGHRPQPQCLHWLHHEAANKAASHCPAIACFTSFG